MRRWLWLGVWVEVAVSYPRASMPTGSKRILDRPSVSWKRRTILRLRSWARSTRRGSITPAKGGACIFIRVWRILEEVKDNSRSTKVALRIYAWKSPIYDSCSSSLFSQELNSLCANPDCAALIEVLVCIDNFFYNRYMYYFYFSRAVRQPKARRYSAHNGAIISLY